MRKIQTSIEIEAPPARIWEVLTDFTSYEDWNPHINSVSGNLREGDEIDIQVQQGGSRSQWISVRLTSVEPPTKLQWVGSLFHSKIFKGEHTFTLHEIGENRTLFVNHELISGLLVPILIRDDVWKDYDEMNHALGDRVEEKYSNGSRK